MTTKYEIFFEKPYKEIKKTLKNYIKPALRILDIGCNSGNIEDFLDSLNIPLKVKGIDTDKLALKELSKKNYKNLAIKTELKEANQFLKEDKSKYDIILINTTLHEINDCKNQKEYLKNLFEKLKNSLKKQGRIILGDYYYPDMLSDDEVNKFIKYQKASINHADKRNKFIQPILLEKTSNNQGFKIILKKDMRAVKEINRRYYLYVFQNTNP